MERKYIRPIQKTDIAMCQGLHCIPHEIHLSLNPQGKHLEKSHLRQELMLNIVTG